MKLLTQSDVDQQYRTLSPHQRARIMIVHAACQNAVSSIFHNTPHTEEVQAGIEELRRLMDAAVKAIETEHLR